MNVDAQAYIDALKEQRNAAMDQAALAVARSVGFQQQNAALQAQVEALKEVVQKLEEASCQV